MTSKIGPDIRASIEAVVGAGNAFSGTDKTFDYGHDEFSMKEIAREPDLVVRPGTTDEVAAVLKVANAHGIPVTPEGRRDRPLRRMRPGSAAASSSRSSG